MRSAAFVALVALAALGLGFYAGLRVGESRSTDVPQCVSPPASARVGPYLRYVEDKVTPQWLERWIHAPEAYRVDTPMPSFR
jgi:hypothetical protein